MNIVMITNMYSVGGGERNLIELADELHNDNNVIVLVPKHGGITDALDEKGIDYELLQSNVFDNKYNLGKLFFEAYNVAQFIKNQEGYVDVVHSNSTRCIVFGKLLGIFLNAKTVWTCHGPWEVPSRIKSIVYSFCLDAVVSITPEINDMLNFSRQFMVPLGITPFMSKNLNENKSGRIKLLCVARWQYIKGQDILLRALCQVRMLGRSVELHFMGGFLTDNQLDREYYHECKNYIEKYGLEEDVYIHGHVADVREHLTKYDVLCIPSRYESFSIALLEGMQSGMYVIAPNIGGPSYIVEDMVSGILFNAGSVDDLVNKIVEVIDKKIVLDVNKIRFRASHFTIHQQCKKMLEVYQAII